MPAIKFIGSYRFFFYSADHGEPPHVHVECEENKARHWLQPVRLQNRAASRAMKFGVFKR